jgi:four helix bundle protein
MRIGLAYSYRDLIAWQKAKDLSVAIYRATLDLPKAEVFGMTSQMRRAAVSVPCNIAEGQGRASKGEFRHFLGIARGSLLELQTQIIIATELDYLSYTTSRSLLQNSDELLKIINGLSSSISVGTSPGTSKPETRNSKLETHS